MLGASLGMPRFCGVEGITITIIIKRKYVFHCPIVSGAMFRWSARVLVAVSGEALLLRCSCNDVTCSGGGLEARCWATAD